MSNQSLRQQSVRDVTGTALSYEGDWHALFDDAGIAAGPFNGRLLAWINDRLGASWADLPGAMQAFAEDQGFNNWSSMGAFDAAGGPAFSVTLAGSTPAQVAAAGVTATRTGLAWQYDSTGKLTTCPNNLCLYAEDYTHASWANITMGVTPGVTDPDGGTAAARLTANGANSWLYRSQSSLAGINHMTAVRLRRVTGTGDVRLVTVNGSSGSPLSLTSSWQTFYLKEAASGATVYGGGIRIDTSGDEVEIAFSQIEAVTYETSPRTYYPTTSSAYYGPRLDYDPSTLDPIGLLVEPAATNLILTSENLGSASWLGNGFAMDLNAGVAPDGQTTADSFRLTGTGDHYVYQSVSVTSGQTYTFPFFAKPNTHPYVQIFANGAFGTTSYVNFDVSTGAIGNSAGWTGTSRAIGNGYYRCAVTMPAVSTGSALVLIVGIQSLTDGIAPSFTPSGTLATLLWGAQMEQGAKATSYIPTGSASVTRAADVIKFTPPVGVSTIRYTFDDDSTQDVSVTGGVEYTIPTNLNRPWIKSIVSV